jgi:hypothetical protein
MAARPKSSPNVESFPRVRGSAETGAIEDPFCTPPTSLERSNQKTYIPGTSPKPAKLDAKNLGEMLSTVDLSLFFDCIKGMEEEFDESKLLEVLKSCLKEPKVRFDLAHNLRWRLTQSSTQLLGFSSAVAWTECPRSEIFDLDRAALARSFPKAAWYRDQNSNHTRMIERLVDGGVSSFALSFSFRAILLSYPA